MRQSGSWVIRHWRTVDWRVSRVNMKEKLFEELLQSVKEAAAIERGELKPPRRFEIKSAEDVARVRKKLGVSQNKFAQILGISENTLQNWEQGRRKPTGAAKVLLKVAARHPKIVLDAAA
jgi:putative transcriptional regulator